MSLIRTEIRGPVAYLTLDRAEAMNALGRPGDGDQIAAACAAVNADWEVRCVVLTGAGRAFSAGGDVKAMAAKTGAFAGGGVAIREAYRTNIHKIVRALYGLETPLIAAVNGPAIGLGCDLACLADVRLASAQAKFSVSFLKLGLVPGDGGAWVLPRAIGMSRAAQMFFTGETIDAATAKDWGLVSDVHPPEALMDKAAELAGRIAEQPPHALRFTKALLRQGQSNDLATVMELSAQAQALAHLTEDHREGVEALLAQRPPKFRGA